MTNTLDLPQHIYVCMGCGQQADTAHLIGHPPIGCRGALIRIMPTLTYADFESYMLSIWDRLEAHTDTSETNREAIDAAIRAVGRGATDV